MIPNAYQVQLGRRKQSQMSQFFNSFGHTLSMQPPPGGNQVDSAQNV